MSDILQNLLTYFIPIVLVIALIIILAMGYVKAPPDRAFIISGLKKEPKILIGRAGIRVPFLERLDKIYLGQMTVDIKTEQSVPTTDFINVNVDAVAKVRIDPTTEGIRLAAKNFLNKNSEQITRDLQDSLQGNMREIIGTLTLKSINTDRDSFSDQVMEKASKDMKKLGILCSDDFRTFCLLCTQIAGHWIPEKSSALFPDNPFVHYGRMGRFYFKEAVNFSPSASIKMVFPVAASPPRIRRAARVSTCFCIYRFKGLAPYMGS